VVGTLWITLAVLGGLAVLCVILLFTPVGRWVGNRVAPRLAKIRWVRRFAVKRMAKQFSTPEGLQKLARGDDPATRELARRLQKMNPRERRQAIGAFTRMASDGDIPDPDAQPRAQRRGHAPTPQGRRPQRPPQGRRSGR
jgi:hypothetical protein